jgi:hypothetical protein
MGGRERESAIKGFRGRYAALKRHYKLILRRYAHLRNDRARLPCSTWARTMVTQPLRAKREVDWCGNLRVAREVAARKMTRGPASKP